MSRPSGSHGPREQKDTCASSPIPHRHREDHAPPRGFQGARLWRSLVSSRGLVQNRSMADRGGDAQSGLQIWMTHSRSWGKG